MKPVTDLIFRLEEVKVKASLSSDLLEILVNGQTLQINLNPT